MLAQTLCVHQCVSPACAAELYGDDPLEEGEVDVRAHSFRACAGVKLRDENRRRREQREQASYGGHADPAGDADADATDADPDATDPAEPDAE